MKLTKPELDELREVNPPDDPRMFRRFIDTIDALEAELAAVRLEEAQWWFTRVAMAALGEDPQSECRERIAPLRGDGQ